MWVDFRTHVNYSLYNLLACYSITNNIHFTCVHSNRLMQATNMLIFIVIYGLIHSQETIKAMQGLVCKLVVLQTNTTDIPNNCCHEL